MWHRLPAVAKPLLALTALFTSTLRLVRLHALLVQLAGSALVFQPISVLRKMPLATLARFTPSALMAPRPFARIALLVTRVARQRPVIVIPKFWRAHCVPKESTMTLLALPASPAVLVLKVWMNH